MMQQPMVKRSGSKNRRIPLRKDQILRAAIAVADASGIDALSMRSLGNTLGVEAMSLYKHVSNKDDLLDGMVDMVIGEFTLPAIGGDWKKAMRQRGLSAHEVLMRHPWATLLIASRMNVGPAMFRYIDATLGCLREAGFSHALADHGWNALDSYIYGFTLQQLNFPIEPSEYSSAARAFLPMIPADKFPYLHSGTRVVAEGKHDGINDIRFGLDLILDGLERLLPPRKKSR